MGTKLFDYLDSTVLFDDAALNAGYAGITNERLRQEIGKYREFVDNNLNALRAEVANTPGRFKIVADGGRVDLSLLKQCAWYAHQFIMHDPLYALGTAHSVAQAAMEQLLGVARGEKFERGDLIQRIRLLKTLTPMVAADFVKFLPISRLFEPPKELPLTFSPLGYLDVSFSPNGYSDVLPKPLLNWMRERGSIEEVSVVNGELIGRPPSDGRLTPRRAIGVRFGDVGDGHMYIYHLLQQHVTSLDPTTRVAKFVATLPETPPSQEQFDAWVRDSINKSAEETCHRVLLENLVASEFGASYMTRSAFNGELLQFDASPDRDIARHTMNTLLSLDLPFAADADVGTLMCVRLEDGDAFETLRVELEKQFRELQLEHDPEKARRMAAHAVHELEAVAVTAVANKVRGLKAKGRLEGALGVAGLVGSVLTQGWSLIATAGALLTGAKTAADYWSGIREHPAFFLWKVKNASAKRGPLKDLG